MAYIEQTFVDGVTVVTAAWLNGLKDVLGAASLFQIYNSTQTYNVGDFVSYQAKLYKCTTQIAVPEAWNPAHWTTATIADYVSPQKIFWGEYGVSTFAEIDAAINGGMLPLIKYNVTEYNARYAYYKKINKIKYTPQYIVTEYTFEDYQSDDVLTKLTISSATGWRTEETDFHDQLIGIEAQLEAITDQSDNLFNDIIAFNNSTGITRNKNEFVGTASAFQTFFIAPYNLDENKSYTVSFDIYTEGNSSTSGVGLKLCTGTRSDPDEGGYEFDNDQLEPYHYKGWYAISFGPVVQDRAWGIYFEADSAPDNVWHISNIELTEGEEELEEYKPRYTAKDDVARSGVEENTEKIEDVEDYALGAYIENEASGAVVSFSDGAEGLPVKELTVDIEPVQDLHGYDNPWPAGGGKNLLPISERRSSTNAGVTWTNNQDGSWTVNGTATSNSFPSGGTTMMSLGVLTGGDYTASLQLADGTLSSNVQSRIYKGSTSIGGTNNTTFTVPDGNTDTYYLTFRVPSGITVSNETIYPQFEIGSTITPFAPYENICPISGWTGANVTRCGKNLCSGIEQGNYSATGVKQDTTVRLRCKDYIPISENKQYTISGYGAVDVKVGILYFSEKGEHDISESGWEELPYTFTPPSNSKYILFILREFYGSSISPEDIDYLQLEEGSTDTDYEEYLGTTYPITFPSGTGTVYGGTLDVTNGVLTVDRKSVEIQTLDWYYDNSNALFTVDIPDMKSYSYTSNITKTICSSYKYKGSNKGWASMVFGEFGIANKNFRIKDTRYETASAFKTALTGETILYELAEPISIHLTASQITTLLGQNNVWADCGDISNLVYYVGMDFLIAPITTSQIDALF